MPETQTPCHCGNNLMFEQCCAPFIKQTTKPDNAEQLMRSRFTAFKLRQHQYIIDTQRLDNQPPATVDSFDLSIEWLGLYVLAHHTGGNKSQQQVEFVAFFKGGSSNRVEQMHELSSFQLKQGQWMYTSGQHLPDYKVPRNSLCFCLSGKKYKKCHALS